MILKQQKMTHNIYEPEYNWNCCWDSMLVRAIASNLEYARFGFFYSDDNLCDYRINTSFEQRE